MFCPSLQSVSLYVVYGGETTCWRCLLSCVDMMVVSFQKLRMNMLPHIISTHSAALCDVAQMDRC